MSLASANIAVLLITLGLGFIFLECNRPGSILPGALGVLFTLLALPTLLRGQHRLWAVVLLAAAAVVLALPLARGIPILVSLLSGLALILALHLLFRPARISWLSASLASIFLTALATPLAHAARRSRMAKRVVHQSR